MAVFQDYTELEKIGSIRSTRRYYLDFALDQSAVLVHFGDDTSIHPVYDAIGCRHMEGMYGQYNYWRSTDRVAPHNVYTDGQSLVQALDDRGFGSKMEGPVEDPMFVFFKTEKQKTEGLEAYKAQEGAFACTHIQIPYMPSSGRFSIVPEYNYNAETGLYERWIYGGDQYDKEYEDEKVTCKNVFIMLTDLHARGDSSGHMDITTIGEGDGYYVCEGTAIPVK